MPATYTLKFNADTSQAKQELQSLQKAINDVVTQRNNANPLKGFTDEANKAASKIAELNAELQKSTNNNGTLNIAKLANLWKENGKSLDYYKEHFKSLGPEGERAFNQLAVSIANAERPIRELDGLMGKFFKGLMNTAMWTIQSQAIHGFQRALSGAFSYAKQLNQGLTDIAIVADMSSEKLAQFAKDANKYAQQWSTTTNEYVKGALIYYQQGLSGEEVIEKTNTTVKLANTSGETAEQISSYMTAIWNNFDDGSKSIEYYADVISYLGAATAASNADIAEGMQAFAATANTVGLSYEYAASALTTLRHVTQQSSSTIGNSLKTIFARLSSLKTGEVTEDGVDLTKYTKELAKYGVNVVDVNGDLKDMDQILDELAEKWVNLSNAQKVALAQTVGGVRQYNNLISLMDNYEYFQELVQGSYNSTGYLNKQSEIYEKSWQAATDHVRAAIERLYDILIDDKILIKGTNLLAKFINLIGEIVEKAGGLRTLFPLIISYLSTGIGDKLNGAVQKISELVNQTFKWKEMLKDAASLRANAIENSINNIVPNIDTNAPGRATFDAIKKELIEQAQELKTIINEGAPDEVVTTMTAMLERQARALADFANKQNDITTRLKALETALPGVNVSAYTEAFGKLGGLRDFVNGEDFTKLTYSQMAERFSGAAFSTGADKFFENFGGFEGFTKEINFKNHIVNGQKAGNKEEFKTLLLDYIDDFFFKNIDSPLNSAIQEAINEKKKEAKKGKSSSSAGLNKKEDTKDTIDNTKAKTDNTKSINENTKAEKENAKAVNATEKEIDKERDSIVALGADEEKARQDTDALSNSTYDYGENLKKTTAEMEQQRLALAMQISNITAVGTAYMSMVSAGEEIYTGIGKIITSFKGGKDSADIFVDGLKTIGSSLMAMMTGFGQYQRALGFLEKSNPKLAESFAAIGTGISNIGASLIPGYAKLVGFTGAEIEATGTSTALSFSLTGLGTAIKGLGTSFAKLLIEMLPVAVGVLAIAGAIKLVKLAWDNWSPQGKLKKAQEAAEASAKAAEEEEDKYNQLITTLSTVEDKKEELLKNSNKSSRQWKQGLKEINDEYKEIIKNLNLIQGEDWRVDENGLIEFINPEEVKAKQAAKTKEADTQASIDDVLVAKQDYLNSGKGETYVEGFNGQRVKVGEAEYDEDKFNAYLNEVSFLLKDQAELQGYSNDALMEVGEYMIKQRLFGSIINNPEELAQWLSENLTGILEQIKLDNPEVDVEQAPIDIEKAYRIPGAQEDLENEGNDFSKKDKAAIEDYANELKTGGEYAEYFSEKTLETEGSVLKVATAYKQAKEGIEEWTKSWYDWNEVITTGDKLSNDYIEAMAEIKDASADFLGITDELSNAGMTLGSTFGEYVANNMDVVYAAFSGSEEAAMEMQRWAAEDMANQLGEALNLSEEHLSNLQSYVSAVMDDMQAALDSGDLKVGRVDDTELLASLEEMINSMGLSVAQAEALLASMGFDAEVVEDEDEKTVRDKMWIPATYAQGPSYEYGVDGQEFKTVIKTADGRWEPVEDTVSQPVKSLKIKTADYVGGGNITTKKTGGTRKPGNRSPKKSGGGGGHEKKTKQKDTQRYHEVTQQLKQNKNALELLNQSKDRAFGQSRIDSMKQEIELLKQQAELYKELAKEAQGYYDKDRANLEKYGAKFNDDGTIDNFEAWYDAWVDKYNNGSVDDDWWSGFEDAIKKYEQSLDKLHEAEKGYRDAMNKIYDERLEIVTYKVKYLNGLIEDSTEYLDYLIKRLDDNIYKTADSVALIGQKVNNAIEEMANVRNGIIEILTNENHPDLTEEMVKGFIDGEVTLEEILEKIGQLTDKEQEQLREYRSELLKWSETLQELRKEAYDKISEALDKFNDKIQRQKDIVSDLEGVMKHYRNVIDIVGKDILGISDELLRNMSKLSVTAAKGNLAIATNQLNANRRYLETLIAERDAALSKGLEEDARILDEKIEEQEDRVRELAESWASNFEDALKAAEESFKNSVELAADAFDKAVSGTAGSLANLQEYFDQQTNLNEQYLPTYERIYELNKLTRDVNNAINNTDNIKGKERLKKLQEDILKAQQEGTELSKYDVEFMQKRLELEQAQIAMEEARNAKNMVRMTRDNEGNWSYTYTQNPEELDKAVQNYEDKLHDLEKLNQDHIQEVQSQMLKAFQDYKNQIAGLDMSDEERKNHLVAYWGQLQSIYGDAFGQAIDDGDWITNTYGVYNHNLVDTFDETTMAMTGGYASLEDLMNSFANASEKLNNETTASFRSWEEEYTEIMDLAGTSVDGFKDKVVEDMGIIKEAMIGDDEGNGGAVNAAKHLVDELNTEFAEILDNLDKWFNGEDGLSAIIDAIVGKNDEWWSSIDKIIKAYGDLSTVQIEKPSSGEGGGGGSPGGGGGSPGDSGNPGGSEPSNPSPSPGSSNSCNGSCKSTCTGTCGGNSCGGSCGYGCGGTCGDNCASGCGSGCTGQCVGMCTGTCKGQCKEGCAGSCSGCTSCTSTCTGTCSGCGASCGGSCGYGCGTACGNGCGSKCTGACSGKCTGTVTAIFSGYGTGGYTGEWGPGGKLAMLHEKELILNKEDTANMLQTVGFVRDLVDMLTTNAGISASGLGDLFAGSVSNANSYLDQNVTIHAEFPNATNHSEIEEAFENLIGLAGQYAGRKK